MEEKINCKSIQRVQEEVAQLLRPLHPTSGEKQLQGAYEASRPGGKVGQHPSIRGCPPTVSPPPKKTKRRVGHFVV